MDVYFVRRAGKLAALVVSGALVGCASHWKIRGGPTECMSMCSKWNMEFVAIVALGSQDATGEGATACVCQVSAKPGAPPSPPAGSAAPTSLRSTPIIAAEVVLHARAESKREDKRADSYAH
jgi:hypothetical protein